jgi:Mg2+ and Co2+ transporter CorA
MPELPTEYGYFFALGSMAGVAIGLMSWFYWNGWLS